jgi:hypothetical protein
MVGIDGERGMLSTQPLGKFIWIGTTGEEPPGNRRRSVYERMREVDSRPSSVVITIQTDKARAASKKISPRFRFVRGGGFLFAF